MHDRLMSQPAATAVQARWACRSTVMSTEQCQPESPPLKPRFFRYSLRTLLIVVTVLCISFAWLGVQIKRVREHRQAVVQIEKLGGIVTYDWDPPGQRPVKTWARKLFGDDFLNSEMLVWFSEDNKFNDTHIIRLIELPNLKFLSLESTEVTNSGLEQLNGMTNLEELSLSRNHTAASLTHLKTLPQLRYLEISETQITGSELRHLKELPGLEGLGLRGSQLDANGWHHFMTLRNIRRLDITDPNLTDENLDDLCVLTWLDYLNLLYTQVTDEGVDKLLRALPTTSIGVLRQPGRPKESQESR